MLIKRRTVLTLIETSFSGLSKIAAKNPDFPKPIKLGDSRQAAVFYDESEILDWIESKKAERLESKIVNEVQS